MAMPSIIPTRGGALENIGQALGSGLGTGLGSGLNAIANLKLQQIQQRNQQVQYKNALQSAGYSPEESELISLYPPEAQIKIMQAMGPVQQATAPQYAMPQMQQKPAEQVAVTAPDQLKPALQAQMQQKLASMFGQQPAQKPYENLLMAAAMGKPYSPYADLFKTLSPAQIQQLSGQMAEAAVPKPAPSIVKAAQVPQIPLEKEAPTSLLQRKSLRQAMATYETPQMKLQRELAEKNMSAKEKAQQQRTLEKAYQLTTADRKEIRLAGQTAKRDLNSLERMEELETSGKLDTPGYVELLKRSGFDIPALMNPEGQEFQKLAMGFIRDAKSAFGARVSNFELENFLKTIPNLSQSPEGRRRVIANLKYIARAKADAYDTMRDIMKENKNVPPLDLMEEVDDRIDKKMNLYAKKFREDLAKPVPAAQNRLVTALGAALGSGAGLVTGLLGLPKALGSAIGGGSGGAGAAAVEAAAL